MNPRLWATLQLGMWSGVWSCSTGTPPPSAARTSNDSVAPAPLESRAHESAAPAEASNTAEPASPTPPAPSVEAPPSEAPFTPPEVIIPSARSASPEDGRWTPWPEGQTALYRTTVHPHHTSKFVRLDVVAIDLRSVELHWVPGTLDDEKGVLTERERLGLIPAEHHEATRLVFNGGFQPRHGRWGLVQGDRVLQPPKPEGCVVVSPRSDSEGTVAIGPWVNISRQGDPFAFVRQTPPCLLQAGDVSAELLAGRDKAYAGNDPNLRTRRRSALGLDASRRVLFYALGTETEPVDLARGLAAVSASEALQLDINWNWTRCLLPGRDEQGRVRAREALVEGMPYGKNEYFSRPSERDFFYLTARGQ